MISGYLDRKVTEATSGVSASYSNGNTTFTLPYSVATDGTEGVVMVFRRDKGVEVPSSRPTATSIKAEGNLVGVPVDIGVIYETTFVLSTLYFRGQDGSADTRGRLQLRTLTVTYEDSTDFLVSVATPDKGSRVYVYHSELPQSGDFHVPILERTDDVTITIKSSKAGALAVSGLSWEGTRVTRGRLL